MGTSFGIHISWLLLPLSLCVAHSIIRPPWPDLPLLPPSLPPSLSLILLATISHFLPLNVMNIVMNMQSHLPLPVPTHAVGREVGIEVLISVSLSVVYIMFCIGKSFTRCCTNSGVLWQSLYTCTCTQTILLLFWESPRVFPLSMHPAVYIT